MHYESYEDEDEEWRVHHADNRRLQHHHQKPSFPFIKLPSFKGERDTDVYLGWKAKVDQIFNVYEVDEDQKVKLASLEFCR